jgi:hypothetical protein
MAKKDARQESLKKGLVQMLELGFDEENVSAASLNSLTAQLGKDHDSDLAVAFLLGRVADPAAVDALTTLERKAHAKEIKREARRSLFKLAQRGMGIPRAEQTRAAAPRPALKLGPEIEGYISSVDGPGVRLVWLAKPQAASGLQLFQGMVSDRVGLARVNGSFVKRKELRERAQTIKESHGVSMIPVPWEYADRMLYEGYDKAKALGQGETEHFLSLRSVFNPLKPKPAPHPVYDRLSAESAQTEVWRERSRLVLDEPEFRFWILDQDWTKPYLERVEEAQGSRLVLNEAQKEERFSAIVRDAAREIFTGETGRIFTRRMEDMALYLLETGREEPAKLALAVALQLAEGEIGILDISFLTGLVQKSMAFYLSQAKEKAADEPSLIVKP